MKKSTYTPGPDNDRLIWHTNYSSKLNLYATRYGITPAEIAQALADTAFLSKMFSYRQQFVDFGKALTEYKSAMMNGTDALLPITIPVPAPLTPTVPPGIFVRVASIVNRIKGNHLVYTEADGQDLGIVGTEEQMPDSASHKPVLILSLAAGGMVNVSWLKGHMDAIRIEYMDAAGVWQLLAIDTQPGYVDTIPATGPELRRYRAIYLLHDQLYGQYSDVASISIGA